MAYPRRAAASAALLLLRLLGCRFTVVIARPPYPSSNSSSISFADDVLSLLQRTQVSSRVRGRQSREASERSLLSKRVPLWRISLQGFSDGDMAQDEHLVMNHLAKCGGTFVKNVLYKSIPGTRLSVEDEAESVTKNDFQNNNFIIGLIRNPFNYYVSLWAFTSDPDTCCFKAALTEEQQSRMLGRASPLGSTANDRKRFKKWLFTINNPDLGTESSRFYGSYLYNWGEQHWLIPKRWHYLASSASEMQEAAPDVNAVLSNFTVTGPRQGPVDCWIQTEDLANGLKNCLAMFEDQTNSSVVDWAALNRSLVTEEDNDSPHVPCEDLYDNESLALVASADKNIIRAFGYPNHCR